MKKLFSLTYLLTLLIVVSPCLAQNARKDDVAMVAVTQQTSIGTVTVLEPVPGALITIGQGNGSCAITSGVAVCSPLAQICSSSFDVVCSQPNPTNADSNGNYGFYLKPGRYTVAITSLSTSGRIIVYDLIGGFNDSLAPIEMAVIPNISLLSSASSSLAQSGLLRLGNGDHIAWGTGGGPNSDDLLTVFGPNGSVPINTLFWTNLATGALPISGSAFVSQASGVIPSVTGAIRLASVDTINWRNNAGSGDLALSKNSSDNLVWPNSIVLAGLTPGGCVQAGAGGVLTTVGGSCTSSGGSVTVTGSPASPQIAIFSSGTSITDAASGFVQCGSPDYSVGITVTGTAACAQVNFSQLGGNIAVTQMNSGTNATAGTFWRGDGIWAAPTSAGVTTACTAIGPVTVTNTLATTSLLTCTVPASTLNSGSLLEVSIQGIQSTASSQAIFLSTNLGGATACSTNQSYGVANNQPWNLVAKFFVLTSGTSGTGNWSCEAFGTGGSANSGPFGVVGAPTIAVNTTINNAVLVTVAMSIANAGNSVTAQGLKVVVY